MSNRANKLLVKAERYLDAAQFFDKAASDFLSASEELKTERAIWLNAIGGLMVTYDGFQKRVDEQVRMSNICHHRYLVYLRKHDRLMRSYYRYIGTEPPTLIEETEFFIERHYWALLKKVGYGRYFGPRRKVRRDNHPSLF